MRETGPVGISFSGDVRICGRYVSLARTLLGKQTNYMKMHNLPSSVLTKELPDRTIITLTQLPGDIKRIHIDANGVENQYNKHGFVCVPVDLNAQYGWGLPFYQPDTKIRIHPGTPLIEEEYYGNEYHSPREKKRPIFRYRYKSKISEPFPDWKQDFDVLDDAFPQRINCEKDRVYGYDFFHQTPRDEVGRSFVITGKQHCLGPQVGDGLLFHNGKFLAQVDSLRGLGLYRDKESQQFYLIIVDDYDRFFATRWNNGLLDRDEYGGFSWIHLGEAKLDNEALNTSSWKFNYHGDHAIACARKISEGGSEYNYVVEVKIDLNGISVQDVSPRQFDPYTSSPSDKIETNNYYNYDKTYTTGPTDFCDYHSDTKDVEFTEFVSDEGNCSFYWNEWEEENWDSDLRQGETTTADFITGFYLQADYKMESDEKIIAWMQCDYKRNDQEHLSQQLHRRWKQNLDPYRVPTNPSAPLYTCLATDYTCWMYANGFYWNMWRSCTPSWSHTDTTFEHRKWTLNFSDGTEEELDDILIESETTHIQPNFNTDCQSSSAGDPFTTYSGHMFTNSEIIALDVKTKTYIIARTWVHNVQNPPGTPYTVTIKDQDDKELYRDERVDYAGPTYWNNYGGIYTFNLFPPRYEKIQNIATYNDEFMYSIPVWDRRWIDADSSVNHHLFYLNRKNNLDLNTTLENVDNDSLQFLEIGII